MHKSINISRDVVHLPEERHALQYLNVHFDDGLTNGRCAKEGPEWNQEMATANASQVKQRIWNLRCHLLGQCQNAMQHSTQQL
jgi:hypothetical protein